MMVFWCCTAAAGTDTPSIPHSMAAQNQYYQWGWILCSIHLFIYLSNYLYQCICRWRKLNINLNLLRKEKTDVIFPLIELVWLRCAITNRLMNALHCMCFRFRSLPAFSSPWEIVLCVGGNLFISLAMVIYVGCSKILSSFLEFSEEVPFCVFSRATHTRAR